MQMNTPETSEYRPFKERNDCGHPGHYCTFGDSDKTVCDVCSMRVELGRMLKEGKTCLYLSRVHNDLNQERYKLTNWPGTLEFPVMGWSKGKHNIAGSRIDVWFRGPDYKVWWGVQYGDNTQLAHCRRTKLEW